MNQEILLDMIIKTCKRIEIPEILQNYISQNDMGMKEFLRMFKDEKTFIGIPNNVRAAYGVFRHQLVENLELSMTKTQDDLKKLKENDEMKEDLIQDIMQRIYVIKMDK